MKIGFLGDIHANLEALTAVLEAAAALGVDKYVCIGDIVGYNPNPVECIKLIRGLDTLCIVKGNHDEYAAGDIPLTAFNPQAAAAIEWTRRQLSEADRQWLRQLPYKQDVYTGSIPPARFTAVHASLEDPHHYGYIFDRCTAAASLQYQWMPLCFVGHTHTPMAFIKRQNDIFSGAYGKLDIADDCKYIINVGSVGQPRDRNPRAAFAIYDVDQATVTLHRVEYDIALTQRKIRAAGLPERCAERLQYGQ